jgi:hypothetical protein
MELSVSPIARAIDQSDHLFIPPPLDPASFLTDKLTDARSRLKAGSNLPPFVHAAYTPDEPGGITWLVPVTGRQGRHIVATTTCRQAAVHRTKTHGLSDTVAISFKTERGISLRAMGTDLVIPRRGQPKKANREPEDVDHLPIVKRSGPSQSLRKQR